MTTTRRSRTVLGTFAGAAVLLAGLVSCAPGFDMVRTDPGLYPIFQLGVIDYVNRCDPDQPTDVSVSAPDGTTVSIDGQTAQGGNFTAQVDQEVNERFTIVVSSAESTTTHHVRCLPLDFPEWEAERAGTPQATYYSTVIIEGFQPNYPVIFDTNGVPVWWGERQPTFLNTPLANGNLATANIAGGIIERQLDGTPVRLLNADGEASDFHDIILLPNGNYVLASIERRACDLSPWGRGQGRCIFHEFQEQTPDGTVVWRWAPEDDIPLSETSVQWRSEQEANGTVDPWHYNSVEWTGDGFIVSFRHMDAIYKVDYNSKNIVWKLGGSDTPASLDVVGDPVFTNGGTISGQHDARLLPNGDVSLFDNGSRTGRAPRSVVYRISGGTATLVNQVRDDIAPGSGCCGSTRVLPGGNYVTGWGGTPWITEHAPDGSRVFLLDANFIYRAIPILEGFYTPEELRNGMDAYYDGPNATAAAAARVSAPDAEQVGDLAVRLGVEEAELLPD